MGHDKRYEKVRYLLLRKRYYLGLFILLPAFFCLFGAGAFVFALAKMETLLGRGPVEPQHLKAVYVSLERWAYVFSSAALLAGLAVAYSLSRPVKRLLSPDYGDAPDPEEFAALGSDFRDMAAALRRHMATLESMTGGVITVNRQGTVTMANRQAFEILGGGGIASSNIREVFLAGDAPEGDVPEEEGDALGKVLSGAVITTQMIARTGDGPRPIECTISPMRGQSGIEGAVFNFRDISKIREMDKELIKTGRLASIGGLAMTVAHEVRNPLAAIKGFAQLISEDTGPEDKKRLYIDTIIKEADRLNRVVDRLYEMREGTLSPFSGEPLGEMLHRIRLLSEHAVGGKEVLVSEHYDERLSSYIVKDDRVFHGIYNVLLNAYEAVRPGGEVRVSAVPSQRGQCPSQRGGKGGVLVQVESDSAIDEGVAGRLFEDAVSTKGRGRGSGLGIARDAIRRAGGDIEVETPAKDNEDKGKTVFRIWLPPGGFEARRSLL